MKKVSIPVAISSAKRGVIHTSISYPFGFLLLAVICLPLNPLESVLSLEPAHFQ